MFFPLAAAKTIGVNPKINNMNQGYKAAKYNLLWICDSNIRGNLTLWTIKPHLCNPSECQDSAVIYIT